MSPAVSACTLFATVVENLDATTTAPALEPTPNGVRGQGSGCASTVYLRTSDLRAEPLHPISWLGTSRAAHHFGSVLAGFVLPGGGVVEPPRDVYAAIDVAVGACAFHSWMWNRAPADPVALIRKRRVPDVGPRPVARPRDRAALRLTGRPQLTVDHQGMHGLSAAGAEVAVDAGDRAGVGRHRARQRPHRILLCGGRDVGNRPRGQREDPDLLRPGGQAHRLQAELGGEREVRRRPRPREAQGRRCPRRSRRTRAPPWRLCDASPDETR